MSNSIDDITYNEFIDAVAHRVIEMQAKNEYSVFKKMLEVCDTVQVVRCRDCVYYIKDPDPIDPGWPMMCADSGRDMLEPDGFCAWGVRKMDVI